MKGSPRFGLCEDGYAQRAMRQFRRELEQLSEARGIFSGNEIAGPAESLKFGDLVAPKLERLYAAVGESEGHGSPAFFFGKAVVFVVDRVFAGVERIPDPLCVASPIRAIGSSGSKEAVTFGDCPNAFFCRLGLREVEVGLAGEKGFVPGPPDLAIGVRGLPKESVRSEGEVFAGAYEFAVLDFV